MFNVIGLQYREYTSKHTHNLVRGYNVFCSYFDEKIEGVGCDSFWISDRMHDAIGGLSVGDDINVYYNRYGRIDKVEVI